MLSRSPSLLALLALGALVACKSSSEPAAPPEDSVFVRTMGELRRIRTDTSLDSASRDSAREATMREHGVTVEELENMARELAKDPERALADWREIERLAAGDTSDRSIPPPPDKRTRR